MTVLEHLRRAIEISSQGEHHGASYPSGAATELAAQTHRLRVVHAELTELWSLVREAERGIEIKLVRAKVTVWKRHPRLIAQLDRLFRRSPTEPLASMSLLPLSDRRSLLSSRVDDAGEDGHIVYAFAIIDPRTIRHYSGSQAGRTTHER